MTLALDARVRRLTAALALATGALLLPACGGGGAPTGSGRDAPTYTLSGTIIGLNEGYVEIGNGLDVMRVPAIAAGTSPNDRFTLDTPLPAGTGYDLKILNDTIAQFAMQCDLINGKGIMPAADVGNILLRCTQVRSLRLLAGQIPLGSGSKDGFATDARFNNPQAVAVDPDGNVLVADTGSSSIRRLSPEGIVSTLAGGAGQYGATDGTGNEARFQRPHGIATDAAGNAYVIDDDNFAVRRVSKAGVVSTIGGGLREALLNYSAIAVGADGTVYLATEQAEGIVRATPAGTFATFFGGAGAMGARGIAIAGTDRLIVSDTKNHVIRTVTPAAAVELAGGAGEPGFADGPAAAARFNRPDGIAVDAAGTVYVADSFNNCIRRIATDGSVTTLAGSPGQSDIVDGTGAAARFAEPRGISLDAQGNLYVADGNLNVIRFVTPAGVVRTVAGKLGLKGTVEGQGDAASFGSLQAIVADAADRNVYVVDGSAIRRITSEGLTSTLAGGSESGSADGPAASARFTLPRGLAVDEAGNVFVADTGNHTIRKISALGIVTTIAGSAGQPGAVDGTGATARLRFPNAVALGAGGNLYVADGGNNTVRQITPAGVVSTLAGVAGAGGYQDGPAATALFKGLAGIAVGPSITNAPGSSGDFVYVTEEGNQLVREIGVESGGVRSVVGSPGVAGFRNGPFLQSQLSQPRGISFDTAGTAYLIDAGNSALRQVFFQVDVGVTIETVASNDPSSSDVRLGPLPQPFGRPQFLAVTRKRIYLTSGLAVLFMDR